jgi:hypothetical protein
MHAKNFCSEFLDIFKNDFRPAGAYAPMSQSRFSHLLNLLETSESTTAYQQIKRAEVSSTEKV